MNKPSANRLRHIISLTLTKTGDGLIDPKLVLSWALNSLGVSQAIIGLLVPLRESLAMLPQVFVAARLSAIRHRKYIWITGSIIQAVAVAAIAFSLWTLGGDSGLIVAGLVALFALGRSLASVSYKDVLGKTVDKGERGSTTGLAGSIAATVILIWAACLSLGILPLTLPIILSGIAIAAGLWLTAAGVFHTLDEPASDPEAEDTPDSALKVLSILPGNSQLMRFTAVRVLLAATALAPPFIMAASASGNQDTGSSLGALGPLVIASAIADIIGSTVWGNSADNSSRKTMIVGGLLGMLVLAGLGAALLLTGEGNLSIYWLTPAMFVLALAYQAVRLGRSTHIVDMAPEDQRSAYAAASNTVVGTLLLFGGGLGLISHWAGLPAVFFVMAATCLTGALLALSLKEVQRDR